MMRDPIWAEIEARPSKLRPFGSALSDKAARRIPKLEPITVRPVKLSRQPCPTCGERRFHCECEEAE